MNPSHNNRSSLPDPLFSSKSRGRAAEQQAMQGALFSPDRKYRYKLWRIWTPAKPRVLFIGLNPSTADEIADDPTIRRCIGFAQAWGYGGLYMGNLFNLVSSNPGELLINQEPVEHEPGMGLAALYEMGHRSCLVVAAWGKLPSRLQERADMVIRMGHGVLNCLGLRVLHCLRLNKDGSPKHPLYLPFDTQPILWEAK